MKKYNKLIVGIIIGVVFFLGSIFIFPNDKNLILIEDVPVDVMYDEEMYIAYGIPDTMDVILYGDQKELVKIYNNDSFKITVDLLKYEPGEYKTKLNYIGLTSNVDVIKIKTFYEVSLEYKVVQKFNANVEVTNLENVEAGIKISNTYIPTGGVDLEGGNIQLSEVAYVNILVDALDLDLNTTTMTLPGTVVAYNALGQPIEVIPPKEVPIKIEYSLSSVSLPVEFEVLGKSAKDKYVDSIESKIKEVVVYGDEAVLKDMTSVKYQVNIDGMKENGTTTSIAILPNGAYMKENAKILVQVTLGQGETITLDNQPIRYENLDSSFKVVGINSSNGTVSAKITASNSITTNIDDYSLVFYIDLSQIKKPGIYELPIKIQTNIYGDIVLDKEYITVEVQYK